MHEKHMKVVIMKKCLNCCQNLKKLQINNVLIEKYKDKNENPNFEQNYYSRSAKGFYKIAHDFIRLMKWLAN